MAWELQQQYHEHIPAAIELAARTAADAEDPEGLKWLAERFADQRCEDTDQGAYDALVERARGLDRDILVSAIADSAIEHSTTTNGSHEVYLDGWTSIPWDDTSFQS